jgi:hypothetical protein
MSTKERLESSVYILTSIAIRREECRDPSIFSSVERQIVERQLKELAAEWAQSPHGPLGMNTGRP